MVPVCATTQHQNPGSLYLRITSSVDLSISIDLVLLSGVSVFPDCRGPVIVTTGYCDARDCVFVSFDPNASQFLVGGENIKVLNNVW